MEGDRHKKRVAVAGALFFGILLVLTFFSNTISSYSVPEVKTAQVISGELSLAVRGTGMVESAGELGIRAEGEVTIKTINVEIGESVKKGDIIATVDSTADESIAELEKNIADKEMEYKSSVLQSSLSQDEIAALEKGERKTLSELILLREEKRSAFEEASKKVDDITGILIELNRQQEVQGLNGQDTSKLALAVIDNNAALSLASNEKDKCQDACSQTDKWVQDYIAIAALADRLDEYKKELERLKSSSQTDELISPEDGVISGISASEGQAVSTDDVVCTIATDNTSYYERIQLSKTQAAQLKVGCEARTTGYWSNDDTVAVLESMQQDTEDPELVNALFKLTGSLTEGQSLTLVVDGSRGYYEQLIPNQAIYTDSEGSFVWKLEVHKGSFGNKYTAIKCPVRVLAVGESSTAVYAQLKQSDCIITNSSAPMEDGQNVRIYMED